MEKRQLVWKRMLASFFIGIFLLLCCSCSGKTPSTESGAAKVDFPIQVGSVEITKSPAKVAVYSSSLADIICALGSEYELKLAARGNDCTHPDVAVLPIAGTSAVPDIEKLEELGVDLVLAEEAFPESAQAAFAEAKIPVLVLEKATDRASLKTLYCDVASALAGGKTGYAAGEKRVNNLLASLDDVARVISDSDTVTVAGYVKNEKGEFATDETLAGKLLSYIDVVNLAADNAVLTQSELQNANPSVLFCAEGMKDTILNSELFAGLDAVKNDHVYEISAELMEWQGKSVLNAVIEMASTLYPTLIEGKPESSVSGTESGTVSAPVKIPEVVRKNSSREDILALQNRLIELGYMQPPGDGVYGYWTEVTVKEFQRRAGLPQTGLADKATMTALFAYDAPKG